jgi:hypothetical protein
VLRRCCLRRLFVTQGCLLVNLLLAAKPEYNAKFSVLAEMAPVFFVQNLQAFYLRLSVATYSDQLLYLLRIGEFLPNRLTAPVFGPLCTGWPLDVVCAASVGFFWFGPSRNVKAADYQGEAQWVEGVVWCTLRWAVTTRQ